MRIGLLIAIIFSSVLTQAQNSVRWTVNVDIELSVVNQVILDKVEQYKGELKIDYVYYKLVSVKKEILDTNSTSPPCFFNGFGTIQI